MTDDGNPGPSDYDLGKTLGAIEQHLKSIDGRLKGGDTAMSDMNDTIVTGFRKQRESMHDCQLLQEVERNKISTGVNKNGSDLQLHEEKLHVYKIKDEEGWRNRARRHAPEIGLGIGGGGGITALILFLLKITNNI